MRKCTGNNWQEWGFDAIFDVKCQTCGHMVELFKDEITRNCPKCKKQLLMIVKILVVGNGAHLPLRI